MGFRTFCGQFGKVQKKPVEADAVLPRLSDALYLYDFLPRPPESRVMLQLFKVQGLACGVVTLLQRNMEPTRVLFERH